MKRSRKDELKLAYAFAVDAGYQGTFNEFAEFMNANNSARRKPKKPITTSCD